MSKKLKIRHVLDGSIFSREFVLQKWRTALFIFCIAFMLIANNYCSEKSVRKSNALKKELKELQTEHLSTLSEYLKKSQASEIAKRLDTIGIKESVVPPKKIFIEKK